jgi:CheY-like chemotaxis protein
MASILVVDDEPLLRQNLSKFLAVLGHDVLVAGNGREALAVIERSSVDLVITDVNMPDMDGLELLNALRGRMPPLPTVVMSGGGRFDKDMLLQSAKVLGAVVSLAKPFSLADLKSAVERALAG